MSYALNLSEDGRYLSSSATEVWCPAGASIVEELPTGETAAERNRHNWRFVDGEWIFDPLPVEEIEDEEPSTEQILNALLGVS